MERQSQIRGLRLADVEDPRVLGSLDRVRGMNDEELRALARDEHPAVREAVESIIADREPNAPQQS